MIWKWFNQNQSHSKNRDKNNDNQVLIQRALRGRRIVGSILGRVIPELLKWYQRLPSLALNIIWPALGQECYMVKNVYQRQTALREIFNIIFKKGMSQIINCLI